MLEAIRRIVEAKAARDVLPPIATSYEVWKEAGISLEEQRVMARRLMNKGFLVVGRTLNDIYYRLTDTY